MTPQDPTRQLIQDTERRLCDQRIKRLAIRLLLAAFAWFMFIPENWETLFWPLSAPLAWVADSIPSIGKMAAVSPMSGVVRGVLASSVVFAPIAGIVLLLNDCLSIRVREFTTGRSLFRILVAPLAGVFAISFLGAFMYWLPFVDVKLSLTPTRGQLLLTAMLTNRLFLTGGAITAGFFIASVLHGILIWLLSVILILSNLLRIGNGNHGKR